MDGRGNLVKRLEDLKRMGARTKRKLPRDIRAEALEDYSGDDDTDAADNPDAEPARGEESSL